MSTWFWFLAGVLTGAGATAVVIPLWRRSGSQSEVAERRPMRYAMSAGCVALFAVSAITIYLAVGSPRMLGKTASEPAHPSAAQPMSGGKALSIEAATAGLEARLARNGGSASDWQLLAQSYEFLGRTEDAARARARVANAAPPGATGAAPFGVDAATVAAMLPASSGAVDAAGSGSSAAGSGSSPVSLQDAHELEAKVRKEPGNAGAWLALANLRRTQRDYSKARAAYVKAIALNGMDAQAWADYADVLASLPGGSLGGDAGRAIDRALAADPTNAKALWLKASRAHQEHRYADALAVWKQLRAVIPHNSPDAALVEANIAEASRLAGIPNAAAAGQGAGPSNTVAAGQGGDAPNTAGGGEAANGSLDVSGTVSIESSLAGRVDKNATLFIYAKAADSPGPPLAVMRTTAATWPVTFRLDDSMAMIPSRRLSQFQNVVVEARISRSGQATPTSGDLYVTSEVIRPGATRKLALVINREIGG